MQTISILLSLLLGYYLGLQRLDRDIKTAKKKAGRVGSIIKVKTKNFTQGKSGAIQRPNAQRLRKINSDGTEEAEAWNNTPGLKELKR